MKTRANLWFIGPVAAGAATLAGVTVLLVASAVHRYRQRRAWKKVHGI